MKPTPLVSIDETSLRKVLEPEFNAVSTFEFGRNPDGSSRTWKYTPLVWKFERNFRKHVMPMLATAYKPFETLVSLLAQNIITDLSPSFSKVMFDSEVEMDDFLERAVHAILVAQDKSITVEWVEENAETRDQLFIIVSRQCELHKIMDHLGESLAERFVKLARMIGLDVDLPTLKQQWKLVSEKLSARITKVVSIADNATGLFMGSSNETMSLPPLVETQPTVPRDPLV